MFLSSRILVSMCSSSLTVGCIAWLPASFLHKIHFSLLFLVVVFRERHTLLFPSSSYTFCPSLSFSHLWQYFFFLADDDRFHARLGFPSVWKDIVVNNLTNN
jgi:hypothetical protein